MQKFLTRQWVDVGNWSVGGTEAWESRDLGTGTSVESPRKSNKPLSISVTFEIFNRSPSPLRIDTIKVDSGILKNGDWQWKTFEELSGLLLRPQSPECGNSEAFTVSFDLEDSEIPKYVSDGFYTRIHVKVFYLDSEGKKIRQDFPTEAVFRPGLPAAFTKQHSRKIKEVDR